MNDLERLQAFKDLRDSLALACQTLASGCGKCYTAMLDEAARRGLKDVGVRADVAISDLMRISGIKAPRPPAASSPPPTWDKRPTRKD